MNRTGPLRAVVAAVAVAMSPCAAFESARAEPPAVGLPETRLESSRLIGDPGGVRSRLEDLGIDLELFYNQFLSGKAAGGGAKPDGVFGDSGSYDFFTRIDLEALTGWRGADLLFHVKGQYDRNLNVDVGSLSDVIDDADFDEGIYVDELWIQQALFRDRLRIRVGFQEQQTYFDRNAFANSEDRQFLASFLDNNGLLPLPNGLAAIALVVPAPCFELAIGGADADNLPRRAGFDTAFDDLDGLTGYLEARFHSAWNDGELPGNYRLGAFLDGRERSDFRSGRTHRGHPGVYLSLDQVLWHERASDDEGLGAFARAGWADAGVNRVAWFWSLGFQYVGAIPGRDRDVIGLGSYQAIGSSDYRDEVDPEFERETGVELYYAARVFGWLVITPDFQYIIDPGANGANDDAFVATLRIRVSF